MQKRRDGMDVSSSCFQQCLAAESVAWTSLSLSLTPSPRAAPLPSFTWAKLNRLVNRWSHSADAAIIKHLDFYLWFIFLERYISYGALVWTYVPPPPPTALSEVREPVKGRSLARRTSSLVISCLHQPSKPTPRCCWRGLPRNLLVFPSSSTNTSIEASSEMLSSK